MEENKYYQGIYHVFYSIEKFNQDDHFYKFNYWNQPNYPFTEIKCENRKNYMLQLVHQLTGQPISSFQYFIENILDQLVHEITYHVNWYQNSEHKPYGYDAMQSSVFDEIKDTAKRIANFVEQLNINQALNDETKPVLHKAQLVNQVCAYVKEQPTASFNNAQFITNWLNSPVLIKDWAQLRAQLGLINAAELKPFDYEVNCKDINHQFLYDGHHLAYTKRGLPYGNPDAEPVSNQDVLSIITNNL